MKFQPLQGVVRRWRGQDEQEPNFPIVPPANDAPNIFREKMRYAERDRHSNTPSQEVPMVVLDFVDG